MKLPKHINLSITHNPHATNYQTVEEFLISVEDHLDTEWKNAESRQKAIETNELWECHWYPRTPISFNLVYAPTLEELLELIGDDDVRTTVLKPEEKPPHNTTRTHTTEVDLNTFADTFIEANKELFEDLRDAEVAHGNGVNPLLPEKPKQNIGEL